MTTQRDVLRVHTDNPMWSAQQIADHLGCGAGYVRATAYRNGWRVRGLTVNSLGTHKKRRQWRCFHCDEVFTDERAAGEHFGHDLTATCACLMRHEKHLVEHIRDLEGQLDSYRDDRDQIMRSIMTLEGEHRRALQAEEEKGYARGLRDALKLQAALKLTEGLS